MCPNMAESTAEWEWVVSSKYCKYIATCSDFAGEAQITILELANTFHLRKALSQASAQVPSALDAMTVDSSLDARLLSDAGVTQIVKALPHTMIEDIY